MNYISGPRTSFTVPHRGEWVRTPILSLSSQAEVKEAFISCVENSKKRWYGV